MCTQKKAHPSHSTVVGPMHGNPDPFVSTTVSSVTGGFEQSIDDQSIPPVTELTVVEPLANGWLEVVEEHQPLRLI